MKAILFFALAAAALPVRAELPAMYKSVDRVIWVVDDIDKSVKGWQRMDLMEAAPAIDTGEGFSWSVARFGDVIVDFVQPTADGNAFAAWKKQHGQGVMGFFHRAPNEAAFDAEIARLKGLGLKALMEGPIADEGARFAIFDTLEGGYALGLIFSPTTEYTGPLAAPPVKASSQKVTQYAFVVKDLDATSKYWERLGWPAMDVTHPALWDLKYHEQPGQFDSKLGWQRQGKVVYEWILPLKGPTVYTDHVAKHGQGFHHLALGVSDMDKATAQWVKAGFPLTQSGAWGERDKPGYGRFAYVDAHPIGGTDVELLWNYRK